MSAAPLAWTDGQVGLPALVVETRGIPPLPAARVLQEQFKLTEAEARFIRQFAISKSLSGAAASLGISAETARRHIKTVFEKTGTHSQIELTQLLLLHPHAVITAASRRPVP